MSKLLNSKTFKVGGLVIAVAMMVGVAAVNADAATTTTTTTTVTASAFTFSGTMRAGMSGPGISTLQAALNSVQSSPQIVVDGKFGPATKAAVMAFQMSHGLTADGVVGPLTGAALASATVAVITVPGGFPAGCTSNAGFSTTTGQSCAVSMTLPAGCTSTSGFSPTTGAKCDSGSSNNGALSGGEASLEDFKVRSGEDSEVEEGAKAQVADFEFDVKDADVRLNRVDLAFETTNTGPSEETDPWKTFDSITLWNADGDEIASEDVSDKSDWLENDPNTGDPFIFRFTGLNEVAKEGDTAHLIVEVEANDSVDGAGPSNSWTMSIEDDGVRAIDASGLDQFTGDSSETENFEVVTAGDENDYSLKTSTEDPDAGAIEVDDTSLSNDELVFAFKIDVDSDSTEDLDFQDMAFNLVVGNPAGGDASITQADVINDVTVEIDGKEYDADALSTDTDDTIADSATDSAEYVIDNDDGDVIVGTGDTVDVKVMVRFKAQTGNYDAQTTIAGNVDTDQTLPLSDWSVVGVDSDEDVTNPNDSVTGDTHTLQAAGINVQPTNNNTASVTVVDLADNDLGVFTIKVEVTAFQDDVFISQSGSVAFTAQLQDASTHSTAGLTAATSTTKVVSSTADTEGGSYRINEGDTETFTFTITVNPAPADEGKALEEQLLTVVSGASAGTPTGSTFTVSTENLSDYRTPSVVIPD